MTQIELLRAWSDARLAELVHQSRPWLDQYGLAAVAIGLFTETLMFTGFVVPGYGILLAAGYLVAAGALPPGPVFVLAVVGAVAGDQASFALGRFAGERLLRRKQKWAARIREGLERKGLLWLLWYHHVPPLRAVLPCVAGSLRYPFARWLALDTLGVILWIATVLGIGYAANGAVHKDSGLAAQALNGVFFIVAIVFLWRVKRAAKRVTHL